MKKYFLLCLWCFAFQASHAEIIKNANGESIELKQDGTWVKLSREDVNSEYIATKGFKFNAKDGSNNIASIYVQVVINDNERFRVLQSEAEEALAITNIIATFGLKNKYSYKPRSARLEQNGNGVVISIEYTAANSYGADVVNTKIQGFTIQPDGKLERDKQPF